MGKAVIIVLFGVIIIYGITNLVINQNIYEMSEKSIDTYSQTKVRNIGNSTAEILKSKLGEDKNFRATSYQSIALDEGSATYRVIDTTFAGESLIKLDISANYLNSNQLIEAFVKIKSSLPVFLSKGVLGEDEVTFNGNQLSVKDTNNPTQNADVHSNYLVKLNGSNYLYEGFVTSSGNVTVDGTNINVIPNSNPSGSSPIQQNVPPITIPNFVASTYFAKKTSLVNGDWTVPNNITLGTSTTPAIIYVKGKVMFNSATTTVTGYGVIIAEQDIEINGNVKLNSPDPLYSKFGLYTNGKLLVNSANRTVEATIYCQNESSLNNENINIIGSITSKSKVTFNGLKDKLFYKPASDAIVSPFWDIVYIRPAIVHWYE